MTTITSTLSSKILPHDAETVVMLTALDDQRKSRLDAQIAQRHTQTQRLALLDRAADKFESSAKATLFSGIFQGATGLASAACQGIGLAKGINSVQHQAWNIVGNGVRASASVDGFQIHALHQQLAKQRLEIAAEKASHTIEREQGFAAENSRLYTSIVEQLKRYQEAISEVARASIGTR